MKAVSDPYTAKSPALAPVISQLTADAFDVFLGAANAAAEAGSDHNDCVQKGWAEVKKAWQRPAAGKVWVRKDDPGAGDVHVDAPLGPKTPKKPKAPVQDDEDCEKRAVFETCSDILKVGDSLGLVFGWAIVCKKDGEDYYDLQGDHIPEDAMTQALCDFMMSSRVAKDMHAGDQIGDIVFAFPMSEDVAKSLGIVTKTTGALIAMKPAADVLQKFKDGTYTGFRIGGRRLEDEEVA